MELKNPVGITPHNHLPDNDSITGQQVDNTMLARAESETVPILVIYRQECPPVTQKNIEAVQVDRPVLLTFYEVRSSLYRPYRENIPKLPQSIVD